MYSNYPLYCLLANIKGDMALLKCTEIYRFNKIGGFTGVGIGVHPQTLFHTLTVKRLTIENLKLIFMSCNSNDTMGVLIG